MKGSAFQHETLGAVTRATHQAKNLVRDLIIALPWPIQTTVKPAPGVEGPIYATQPTLGMGDEGRAGVTHPGIVCGQLDHADTRMAELQIGVLVLRRRHAHGDRLKAGDRAGHFSKSSLGWLGTQAPVVRALGPDHPGLAVWRPFGRHAVTIGAGRTVQGIHRDQDSSEPSRVLIGPYRLGRRSRKLPQALRICSS